MSEYKLKLKNRMSVKQKDLIKISIIGFVSSLMILMIIYVIFAQVFINYIEGSVLDQYNLSIIIIGMFFISLLSSIFAGVLLSSDDINKLSMFKASFISYVFTLITIIFLSYISLFLYYPSVYNGLFGIDFVFIVSIVIVYFTVYILPQFFWLYIIEVIFYYLYFIILLNIFYEEKEEKPKIRSGRFM